MVRVWVKAYVGRDATPSLQQELQGEDVLIDSKDLGDPIKQQKIIRDFLSTFWSKGDKKHPTGRMDWIDSAGLRVSKIPKQIVTDTERKRMEERTYKRDLAWVDEFNRTGKSNLTGQRYLKWELNSLRSVRNTKDYQSLSQQTGRTINALRIKISRLRKKGLFK